MKESCLSALGFPERVERYREVQQAREKWGRGVRHGWERQREITVHEINILVPKGINKDSPRNSGYDTCMDLCNYDSWLSWL